MADLLYQETEMDVHSIAGTSVRFGSVHSLTLDQNNRASDQVQRQSYILGSGRVVSRVESQVVDGRLLPGVGGVCGFCQKEAIAALQAGLISPQQAELLSLVDTESISHCDGCGRRDVCTRHSRPFPTADGGAILLCVDCAENAVRQLRTNRAIGLLLAPFLERPQLPPDQEDGSL